MRLFRYSAREMRRRPGRTALTLIGIAIGVAAIVAIMITTSTTRGAYREVFESLAGRAELEIVAEGGGRFDARVIQQLNGIAGLRAIVPTIQNHSALAGPHGVISVMVMGIDPAHDGEAREYQFSAGRQLTADDQVLLAASFAEANGLMLGDPVRLMAPQGVTSLKITGLLRPIGPAAIAGGSIAFVTRGAAERMYDYDGHVNTLSLVLDDQADANRIEAKLTPRLPPGLYVQRPAARGQLAQDSLLSTQQGLSAMSAVSLVAGGFVVLNTFLMNLSERGRQMAILRAIGATQRQVTRMVLGEAALLGMVGTVIGMLSGVVFSIGLTAAMEKVLGAPLPSLRLTLPPFLLALVVGPTMALAATYIPARRAARQSVLAALFERRGDEERQRQWPALLGAVMLSISLAFVVAIVLGRVSAVWVTNGIAPLMASFLISCVLLMPLVITPLMALAARLLTPLLGVEGKLALRQLARRRTRTSLTVGVLFIAIVVAISMGNSLLNNVRDIQQWTERTITSDYLIRSVMPDTGLLAAAALPPGIGDRIARLPQVERVDRLNFVPVRVNGRRALLLARSHSPGKPLSLDLIDGDEPQVLGRLLQGEAVVGTTLAQRLQVKTGDTFELATRHGPRRIRVAGATTEYTVGGMALYMDRAAANPFLNLRGVDVFMITAKAGQAAAADKTLRAFCKKENLMLQTQADFRVMLDKMMAGVLGSLWLLMALVFVVASLGIVNTLTINALEQTREFGVLRAVGMWRRQVRKMVLAEALALALISLIPGCAVGIAMAWLMNVTVYPVLGHPVDFRLEVGFIAICVVLACVISVLAALLPARRVARLNVVRALQYE